MELSSFLKTYSIFANQDHQVSKWYIPLIYRTAPNQNVAFLFSLSNSDRLVIIDISMVNLTNIIVESQVKQINKEQHTSVSSAEDRLQTCFPERR